MKFITVEELKLWARIDEDGEPDSFFEALIEAASAVVLDHIGKPEHIGWDLKKPATMPKQVKQAVCLAAAALYADRENGNPLTPAVRAILMPLRSLPYA
ncbi:head-tail connector protein [Neisseria shayeganii]|uniref:Phage gp6-like head-tail connector protein n=1 Tax=Neisseria shayeganii TaxID=607712 RepID=A0A7D7NHB3_9NEIS|nr:head-tail connector protein [Neisseria shayeganii]QMT41374.1 phage gp6-like head-tail connector protein [Neisseria shayeganii]